MIESARGKGIDATVCNAEALPFHAEFDAVFSNAALHLGARPGRDARRRVKRVLKPGGRFVAEMGGHGNVAAILVALMAVLDRHGFANLEDGVNCHYIPPRQAIAPASKNTALLSKRFNSSPGLHRCPQA